VNRIKVYIVFLNLRVNELFPIVSVLTVPHRLPLDRGGLKRSVAVQLSVKPSVLQEKEK